MRRLRIHHRPIAIALAAWLTSCGSGQAQLAAEGKIGSSSGGASLEGGNDSNASDLSAIDAQAGGSSGGTLPGSSPVDDSGEAATSGCSGDMDEAGTTSWTAGAPGAMLAVLAGGQSYPFSIVVDATNAYWTNNQAGVMKVPIAGGIVSTLSIGRTGAGIAIDSRSVYWTDTSVCPPGNVCPPYYGEIQSLPLGS